eukprot:6212562-Pleurochrysis_carterae.AAC.2
MLRDYDLAFHYDLVCAAELRTPPALSRAREQAARPPPFARATPRDWPRAPTSSRRRCAARLAAGREVATEVVRIAAPVLSAVPAASQFSGEARIFTDAQQLSAVVVLVAQVGHTCFCPSERPFKSISLFGLRKIIDQAAVIVCMGQVPSTTSVLVPIDAALVLII